jgi:hypothetical protein
MCVVHCGYSSLGLNPEYKSTKRELSPDSQSIFIHFSHQERTFLCLDNMAPKAASTEYSIEEDEAVTKVIDFALQQGDGVEVQLERRRKSLKRIGMLVWNPRARNLRRG